MSVWYCYSGKGVTFEPLVRALRCGYPIMFSLSILLSIHMSILSEISFSGHSIFSLGPIWLLLLHRVPFGRGCAETLNYISGSEVIAELQKYMKNPYLEHIFSPLGPIWFIPHSQSAFDQRICCNQFSRSNMKVIADLYEKSMPWAYLFLCSNLALTSSICFFDQRKWSDLEWCL